MKINKIYQVELSIEDCKRCLYNYQYDAITQLVSQMQMKELLTSVTDVSHFAIGLLKGHHNPEFIDLLKLYNIKWIDTPTPPPPRMHSSITFNSVWVKLVEQFPCAFELDPLIKQYVHDAHGVTKLQVTVDGLLIDTKEILANM